MPFTPARDFKQRRSSILWHDNNYMVAGLAVNRSCAGIAEGCGHRSVTVRRPAELTESLIPGCAAQARRVTTFIDVILNQELGEPFRRDAMKKPVVVAGIRREDRRPQGPR